MKNSAWKDSFCASCHTCYHSKLFFKLYIHRFILCVLKKRLKSTFYSQNTCSTWDTKIATHDDLFPTTEVVFYRNLNSRFRASELSFVSNTIRFHDIKRYNWHSWPLQLTHWSSKTVFSDALELLCKCSPVSCSSFFSVNQETHDQRGHYNSSHFLYACFALSISIRSVLSIERLLWSFPLLSISSLPWHPLSLCSSLPRVFTFTN